MTYDSLQNNKHKIVDIIEDIIPKITNLYEDEAHDIHKNVIDPFSATIEGLVLKLNREEWEKKEMSRQTQKSFQNIIGDFHQRILSTFNGWEDLGTGNILDLVNKDKKIIAEIKNKYNTTKGNHKPTVYDDMKSVISKENYKDYTSYFVEIIPKKPQRYNKEFTPSKNGKNKPKNNKIRVIDGYSFYNIVSEHANTLEDVFKLTFETVKRIKGSSINYREYEVFFKLAYVG